MVSPSSVMVRVTASGLKGEPEGDAGENIHWPERDGGFTTGAGAVEAAGANGVEAAGATGLGAGGCGAGADCTTTGGGAFCAVTAGAGTSGGFDCTICAGCCAVDGGGVKGRSSGCVRGCTGVAPGVG